MTTGTTVWSFAYEWRRALLRGVIRRVSQDSLYRLIRSIRSGEVEILLSGEICADLARVSIFDIGLV